MVRGGETGGQLAETMGRIAGFLESSAKLRRKVKSAMTYPVIVLVIALSIAVAMIAFVVPVFGNMFEDFGADLPGPTKFLLSLSKGFRTGGPIILPLAIIGGIVFSKWKATPSGRFAMDKFYLRMPVFGELVTKVASARFARTFAQLVHSGVPILSSLEIVSGATGNTVAGAVVMEARTAVERGDPLSVAMQHQTVFPSMLVRMMAAGEKTGKIDEMMDSIADFYDDEIETMLSGLTSMIEPFLMVFLGVVVGGILIGMFMPIFKMGEIVGQ
jgi:type IV pilus assembly protein PilC